MSARWLQRLGLPGVMGAVLLGGALWVEQAWLPEQQARIDALGSDARRLRHELQQAQAAASAAQAGPGQLARQPASPEAAWSALWAGLPDASQRLALQREVLQSAQAAGLQVPTVQYQGQLEPWLKEPATPARSGPEATGLWRQRMSMPVTGSYVAVRAWLARLLREPALSLDALDIQRSDVNSDQVRVQVNVSLWWRHAPASPAALKGGAP